MRRRETTPIEPEFLTECSCGTGRPHLRCDCPRAAFEALTRAYLPELRRRVANDSEAEDILQEALCRAWRAWLGGDRPDRPRDWLHRIVRNVAADRARRRGVRASAREQHPDDLARVRGRAPKRPDEPLLNATDEIRDALRSLSPTLRSALELVILGVPYAEIAERLDVPLTTVRVRIYRARQRLRQQIGRDSGREAIRV